MMAKDGAGEVDRGDQAPVENAEMCRRSERMASICAASF